MQQVLKALDRVTELPFSPVAGKILELARDERVGAREIARVITQDQGFTARLLKIANSPHYGQARAVTTVTQAVPVLGIDTISSLATALGSFAYTPNDDGAPLTMREMWEHSIGCAIWGRRLARHIGHRAAEETFIAGLLHDMGKAIFYRFFKNDFLDAVTAAAAENLDLLSAERRFFDADHARAGAIVAAKWNLPAVLMQSIENHHNPLALADDVDDSTRRTVYLVHVADALSDHYQIGRGMEIDVREVDDAIWNFLGVDLGMCQDLLGEVLGEVSEFRSMCDLFSTPAKKAPATAAKPAASPAPKPATPAPPPAPAAPTAPVAIPSAKSAAPAANGLAVNRLMDGVKHLALLAGIDDLCPNIAEQAKTLLETDAACVFLPHGDDLDVVGAAGFPQILGKRFPIAQSLAGWVTKMGETMTIVDIDKARPSWEKSLFTAIGYRSHMILPIDWAGKRIAVLSLHTHAERKWTGEQISLAQTFCGFVAVVLENAGLYREAEERAKALEGLNQELQSALSVKMRFIGKVSHELRSPLCVITGYANLLADGTFGSLAPSGAKSVQRIIGQSDALLTVLTYMLEVSQLDAGNLAVKHGPIEIKTLLDEAADQAPRIIGEKPIEFVRDYAGCQGKVVTDPDRLVEVLIHLLNNAAKFTERGKIVLAARAANKHLAITIADTGIGIDAEHHQMIFEGFRQVEENDARRYDGMGIGLYLVRRLLALLGGEVSVESKLGEGARFTVQLPFNTAD